MRLEEQIGFVGGGKMAEALVKGILKAGLVDGGQVHVADPEEARRQLLAATYGVAVHADGREVVARCRVIVLAVKPQVMGPVLESLAPGITSSHLLISIAAGLPLAFLEQRLAATGCRVIRVMPNTPALVLEGAAAISGGQGVGRQDLDTALALFNAVGVALVMDEKYLDAVTGLSGSGPAYVFSFLEALIDAGVGVGLGRGDAEKLVVRTVIGAARLMEETGEHPAVLRAMVTSPGGTTIAGLQRMERAGFQGIVMDAVQAATERSRELGRG
ncbi:MAG: pyrroline-5-carboxylate reductase [Thermodesulfobacteriota bacterium]